MYLLDSCTISDFMRGDINTCLKLKFFSPTIIYTSSISQMEIIFGLIRRFEPSHKYFKFFEEFISAISVLPFNESSAKCSALIRKTLEEQGKPIGTYDILIAGIAKSADLILVTSNEKEFIRVEGLTIENWRNK